MKICMRRNEGAGNYRQLLGLEFPPTLSLSEELVQFGANVSWKCRQYSIPPPTTEMHSTLPQRYRQQSPEAYGAKESIPPAYVAWRARTTNKVVAPGWESIPGLLKRFSNGGSGNESLRRPHEALQCALCNAYKHVNK